MPGLCHFKALDKENAYSFMDGHLEGHRGPEFAHPCLIYTYKCQQRLNILRNKCDIYAQLNEILYNRINYHGIYIVSTIYHDNYGHESKLT